MLWHLFFMQNIYVGYAIYAIYAITNIYAGFIVLKKCAQVLKIDCAMECPLS